MTVELKSLLLGMITGGFFLLVALVFFPFVEPNAPEQLYRALLLQTGVGIQRILLLLFAILVIDGSTKGEWAQSVGDNPYASAAVYISVVVALIYGFRIL